MIYQCTYLHFIIDVHNNILRVHIFLQADFFLTFFRSISNFFFLLYSVDDLGASNFSTGLNSLSSSGMPTPSSGGTRPGSETNSVDPSCSSALSGVDDRKLDEILGDGIHNQTIYENLVTQELQNQNQLEQEAAQQVNRFLDILRKKIFLIVCIIFSYF